MIGMQHRDLVHRLLDDRIQNIFLRRDSKQHLQEISGIERSLRGYAAGCSMVYL